MTEKGPGGQVRRGSSGALLAKASHQEPVKPLDDVRLSPHSKRRRVTRIAGVTSHFDRARSCSASLGRVETAKRSPYVFSWQQPSCNFASLRGGVVRCARYEHRGGATELGAWTPKRLHARVLLLQNFRQCPLQKSMSAACLNSKQPSAMPSRTSFPYGTLNGSTEAESSTN